jgi:predicted aminopeptidase
MKGFILTALLLSSLGSSGCYYGHLASGQIKLMWLRQPIEEAQADPAHSENVRELLGLVESVREFAIGLGLHVDNQYTSYVDWPGDRVVTTLVRTHANSLETVPWWFPMIGHLPYKGYFDQARAEAEAARLREGGDYDVCVSAISAYSTLGWLDDPVTRPMLAYGSANLVETLLHELVHATAFLEDEADFNESVAQFIGQQAAIRFFADIPRRPIGSTALSTSSFQRISTAPPANWPTAEHVRDTIEDRRQIAERTIAFRNQIASLDGQPDRDERRAQAERQARSQLAQLPLRVLNAKKIANSARLSDACLALRGTYVMDLPRHALVLAQLDGDLPAMIDRLRLWADESRGAEDFFMVE